MTKTRVNKEENKALKFIYTIWKIDRAYESKEKYARKVDTNLNI